MSSNGTPNPNPQPQTAPQIEPEYKPIVDLLNAASQLAERNQLDPAEGAIASAEAALAGLPQPLRDAARGLAIAAALSEGRGQVALRRGDFQGAHTHLGQAEALRQREEAAGGRPNPLARAVSNLNLSSAAQRLGLIPEALEHNARCQALLRETTDPNAQVFLAASLESRGTLLAQTQQFEAALVALEDARQIAAPLAEKGTGPGRSLLAEILVNQARVQHQLKQPTKALELAATAAEVSWQQLEATQFRDQQAASLYIAAEMNQVAFAELVGTFAKAEDALFRVIKLIGPEQRVVERGIAFYTNILTKTDAELEAGDLPRDECEESLGRLRAMVRPAQAPVS
jgi:hypothetical protein